jgi:hypothetical protein
MKLEDLDRLTVGDHVLNRGRVGTVTFATHNTVCVVWPDGDSVVLGPYTPLAILATFSADHGAGTVKQQKRLGHARNRYPSRPLEYRRKSK